MLQHAVSLVSGCRAISIMSECSLTWSDANVKRQRPPANSVIEKTMHKTGRAAIQYLIPDLRSFCRIISGLLVSINQRRGLKNSGSAHSNPGTNISPSNELIAEATLLDVNMSKMYGSLQSTAPPT
jgi:hypothetical protein